MSWDLGRLSSRKRMSLLVALTVALAGLLATIATAAVPDNTAQPTITGASTAREGQTLTATNGTWANSPTSFKYQWQRCSGAGTDCTGIVSATNQSYTPANADVDQRLRVVVTAVNSDGQSSATSATTDVVSGSDAPALKTRPSISGSAAVGNELTADTGTWTGGASSFTVQWQRCDSLGNSCVDVTNATAKSYGVRTADVGHRLRVQVTAKNASSTATASSDTTAVVGSATNPTPTPAPKFNRAPTIKFLSLGHRTGARVVARFRVCDDGFKRVTIVQRDLRFGVLAYTRHFASSARPCVVVKRTWRPAPRFHGRYTASLRAVDKSGKSSRTVSRSMFLR
jgi:hypothetical protein